MQCLVCDDKSGVSFFLVCDSFFGFLMINLVLAVFCITLLYCKLLKNQTTFFPLLWFFKSAMKTIPEGFSLQRNSFITITIQCYELF